MSAIRIYKPRRVYSLVVNLVDRVFAFAPDHKPGRPLLHRDCAPDALDPKSKSIPRPSVINIVGNAFARAQELTGFAIHAVEVNTTHIHIVFSVDDLTIRFVADFLRDALSSVARAINKSLDREGHLFAARGRITECCDDESALKHVLYSMTNAVKDGLTPNVRNSPLFNTYRAQALGRTLRFWHIDWEAFWEAGGILKKDHSPKDYFGWRELMISPLPEHANWPEHKRQTFFRQQVRQIVIETAQELEEQGRAFMPAAKLLNLDPRGRPNSPRIRTPKPKVHASTKELRKAVVKENRKIQRAHREASIAYRLGHHDVEFPMGTFRPPIVKPFDSGAVRLPIVKTFDSG